MAMANMNLIGVFVTKLWPVQALECGGGDGGGTIKNIIPPKLSNFGDIIKVNASNVIKDPSMTSGLMNSTRTLNKLYKKTTWER